MLRTALQHTGKTVMVVTHDGVLDMIWRTAHRAPRTARGTGLDGPGHSDITNAGLNRVRVQGDAVEVLDWVDLLEQSVYDQKKLVV